MQIIFGDYLSVFDGRDLQSQQIQKSDINSNDKKSTISSSGKDMLVHFTTDDSLTNKGFRASINYMHIKPNCVNWLNIAGQLLKSPDYPTIDCSWVITAPSTASTIIIQFETFEVNTFDCIFFD